MKQLRLMQIPSLSILKCSACASGGSEFVWTNECFFRVWRVDATVDEHLS